MVSQGNAFMQKTEQSLVESISPNAAWNRPVFEYIPVNCEVTAYSGDLEPETDQI
jgi:hypothetical protein